MEHLTIEQQIRDKIYRVFELLCADRELLGTIGSWGDTLDDEEALRLLKEWNMDKAKRAAVEALQRMAPQSHDRLFLVSAKKSRATMRVVARFTRTRKTQQIFHVLERFAGYPCQF